MDIKILKQYMNYCRYWTITPTFAGLKAYKIINKKIGGIK